MTKHVSHQNSDYLGSNFVLYCRLMTWKKQSSGFKGTKVWWGWWLSITTVRLLRFFCTFVKLCEFCNFLKSGNRFFPVLFLGVAVRTTMDATITNQYCAVISRLADQARSTIRDLDPTNDITFLRLRSKKNEVLIAPDREFNLVVIQSPHEQWILISLLSISSTTNKPISQ